MNRKEKARLNLFLRYLLLIGLGIVMIYPLCWMRPLRQIQSCFPVRESFPWRLLWTDTEMDLRVTRA